MAWLSKQNPDSELNIYAGCCDCSRDGEIRVDGNKLELEIWEGEGE